MTDRDKLMSLLRLACAPLCDFDHAEKLTEEDGDGIEAYWNTCTDAEQRILILETLCGIPPMEYTGELDEAVERARDEHWSNKRLFVEFGGDEIAALFERYLDWIDMVEFANELGIEIIKVERGAK
jgi:hypothetical protein